MQITLKVTVEQDVYGPWLVVEIPEKGVMREVWHLDEMFSEINDLIVSELFSE